MQRNADIGLFTKPSRLFMIHNTIKYILEPISKTHLSSDGFVICRFKMLTYYLYAALSHRQMPCPQTQSVFFRRVLEPISKTQPLPHNRVAADSECSSHPGVTAMSRREMPCPITRSAFLKSVIMIAVLFFSAANVFAESVEINKIEDQCIVGESLFFNIKFKLDTEKEIDVSKVLFNGKPLKYEVKNSGLSSFSFTVNGKTVSKSSGINRDYLFEIPTLKEGTITIPAFEVKVSDKTYTSKALEFKVLSKPKSSNLLFITKIVNPQKLYYPTQIIDVVCRIYFRSFPGSPSIENINIPILEDKSFSIIPPDSTNWEGIFNEKRLRIKKKRNSVTYKGKQYNLFEFSLKFRLMKSGTFKFNNFIKMQVETGKTSRQRGWFGTEIVKERKTLFAESPALNIKVNELPENNVPASFNGAIGDYKIKVLPSSDTDVKIGDPITLSVEIYGRGTWEFVRCPPLHKIEEITDYFKVSDDPVAGEVSTDGTRKTFLIRMRVKSKTVTQIPPIPFTFFNIVKSKYVTIFSDPIPISIFDTDAKVEIVDFGKKKNASIEPLKKAEKTVGSIEIKDEAEIILPELIQISDNIIVDRYPENHSPQYKRLIHALWPILLVIIIFLINLYKNRDISEEKLAKNKSKNAYKIFLNNIKDLEKNGFDESVFYRELGRNIEFFINNRFLGTNGEPNEEIIENLVESAGISQKNADKLLNIIEKVDNKRYSLELFNISEAKTILKETKEVLNKC